ncbi:hypothetical protein GNY06_01605 [Elizabethkingia argentiflava]|uniref:Uncharacterized protein n=1 Tax=Elizabethkingia argenteiflava TaxID=2681556 RepID=A0A845PR61_9FLAO|nr:hypothetical protein [Elizabethkingia argenteiflava]NAW50135.1 hypothetical protein [Elizabethkingia argenteiflava]
MKDDKNVYFVVLSEKDYDGYNEAVKIFSEAYKKYKSNGLLSSNLSLQTDVDSQSNVSTKMLPTYYLKGQK